MGTTNSDFLPNTTGLNLGSPDQQWDGFFSDLVADNVTFNGVPVVTGNATELQGVPIDPTAPTSGQFLFYNGTFWIPTSTISATQLQGNPVSSGVPSINQALIWDGAAWAPANQSGGGGGGASFGYVAVAFSATPTFTPSPVGSCTFEMTLTGNVTSSTFTTAGLTAGSLITFIINQDGTGGRTFAYPANFQGKTTIGSQPSQTTVQEFLYNGSVFKATAVGISYP